MVCRAFHFHLPDAYVGATSSLQNLAADFSPAPENYSTHQTLVSHALEAADSARNLVPETVTIVETAQDL